MTPQAERERRGKRKYGTTEWSRRGKRKDVFADVAPSELFIASFWKFKTTEGITVNTLTSALFLACQSLLNTACNKVSPLSCLEDGFFPFFFLVQDCNALVPCLCGAMRTLGSQSLRILFRDSLACTVEEKREVGDVKSAPWMLSPWQQTSLHTGAALGMDVG